MKPRHPVKKRWRGKVAAGTVAFAGLFAGLIGPWPLDHDPALEIRAAAVEQASAASRQTSLPPAPAPLAAGWAVAPFDDLPEAIPLAGYGQLKGAPSEPGGEIPAARALSLTSGGSEVVIVMADLLLINRALAGEVRARVAKALPAGETPPLLLFTATHTHCGPGAWGAMKLEEVLAAGRYNPEVFTRLADTLAKAALAARENRGPASIAFARAAAPDLIRNRAIRDGAVDPALEAVLVRRLDTKELGIVALFGAHATCLGASHMRLARDYPGFLVDALEELPEVAFAGFAAGCVGSHSGAAPGSGMEKARNLGAELARRVAALLPDARFREEVRMNAARVSVDVPPVQLRVSSNLRASSLISAHLSQGSAAFDILRIDEQIWITLPVELSGMKSAALREKAAQQGFTLTLSCFNGDYLGYVLPDEHYRDGKLYEARMNFLGPHGGTHIREVLKALLPEAE